MIEYRPLWGRIVDYRAANFRRVLDDQMRRRVNINHAYGCRSFLAQLPRFAAGCAWNRRRRRKS